MMHIFFADGVPCKQPGGLICGDSLPHAAATPNTLRTIFLVAFAIIGSLAFLFMVIAGARYALSKGEPDNVQKAKNEIKYSAIGLVITALAAAIVNFVLDRLK
ncbi:hypothetical protein BVY00_00975 [bacterium G20]|nr:hypothetical protein BVY00_00975 [bacterium G20]